MNSSCMQHLTVSNQYSDISYKPWDFIDIADKLALRSNQYLTSINIFI